MNWITAVLLILLVSLFFQLGLLAYAMYTLLAVMLVSRWLSRNWAEHLEAERECNRLTAEVGDTVAVNVVLKHQGGLPVPWVLVEDLLPRSALVHDPPNLKVRGRRVLLTMIRGGGTRQLNYQLVCNRRGYYQLGPLVVETGDVFGLHRRYRVLTRPHFLLVYPRVMPLEGYEITSRRPIGEVRMAHRLYEDPTRIAGVRQYMAGDPMNRVHWRATARTGLLQSKVYEPSSVAGATLVLDFHADSYPSRSEPFRSELAITAAASLAQALYEMGQQVGLVTNGRDAADRIRLEGWAYDLRSRDAARKAAGMLPHSERLRPVVVPTRRGVEVLSQLRENLARLELTDGLTFPQLISECRSRLPRDATIIAILARVTPENAIALGSLRQQGFSVTALINVYESDEYAAAAGRLLAQGIETRHLRDEPAIMSICRRTALTKSR